MNFTIYLIKAPKNKIQSDFSKAIGEYEKRLSKYCKIKLIALKDKDDLQKYKLENTYTICIHSTIHSIPSEALAKKIELLGINGHSSISILLNIIDFPCDEFINITQMDMDTSLLVTILYEQIYRCFRIIHNQPYHK